MTDIYPERWTALKYMENDEQIRCLGRQRDDETAGQLERIVQEVQRHLERTAESYPEAVVADYRYGYIRSVLKQGVISYGGDRNRLFISDKIDKVVVNRLCRPLDHVGRPLRPLPFHLYIQRIACGLERGPLRMDGQRCGSSYARRTSKGDDHFPG